MIFNRVEGGEKNQVQWSVFCGWEGLDKGLFPEDLEITQASQTPRLVEKKVD